MTGKRSRRKKQVQGNGGLHYTSDGHSRRSESVNNVIERGHTGDSFCVSRKGVFSFFHQIQKYDV